MSDPPPPVPMACQLGPGIGVTAPPPILAFSSISQIDTWPVLLFCHRMSANESWLDVPVPTACQGGPGLALTSPPPVLAFPSISQIETWPVVLFCHRMSE